MRAELQGRHGLGLVLAALLGACAGEPAATPGDQETAAAAPEPAVDRAIFSEEAAARGLDFVHQNGMSGQLYYSEMMGAGVAVFDADGDGDLDVYLAQGHMLPADRPLDEATAPSPDHMLPLGGRLYRNELVAGDPESLRFVDVTAEAGIEATGYGMGVATGDVDNDGDIDLYLTHHGPNQLLRNRGDGTFEEVSAASGVDDPGWGTSAAFVDYDRDGFLDLYVVNYVDYDPRQHRVCRALTGAPDYCGPLAYPPQIDRLYRNRGDGTFEDATARAGIRTPAAGLGVVTGDFDGDGWPDLYVANDGMANFLWRNRGDGTFEEVALEAGAALSRDGQAEAGMGVVAGDVDRDGDEDLLLTHLTMETNTLYRADGPLLFEDVSLASGVGEPSWEMTGFGVGWMDVDVDGWLDLLAVNGAVKLLPDQVAAGATHALAMPNQFLRNRGGLRFEDATAEAGPGVALAEVSRGLAVGDLDLDGDADAVVSNNGGPARLLLTRGTPRPHWLGLRLVDRHGRDAVGALVNVQRPGSPLLVARVRTDGSYLSANDPRLLLGLGESASVDAVHVHWPDGSRESFPATAGRYQDLVQGAGRALTGRDR